MNVQQFDELLNMGIQPQLGRLILMLDDMGGEAYRFQINPDNCPSIARYCERAVLRTNFIKSVTFKEEVPNKSGVGRHCDRGWKLTAQGKKMAQILKSI